MKRGFYSVCSEKSLISCGCTSQESNLIGVIDVPKNVFDSDEFLWKRKIKPANWPSQFPK